MQDKLKDTEGKTKTICSNCGARHDNGMHACWYALEMYGVQDGDAENQCDCCDDCAYECYQDV
jgi:hypothetical protein